MHYQLYIRVLDKEGEKTVSVNTHYMSDKWLRILYTAHSIFTVDNKVPITIFLKSVKKAWIQAL